MLTFLEFVRIREKFAPRGFRNPLETQGTLAKTVSNAMKAMSPPGLGYRVQRDTFNIAQMSGDDLPHEMADVAYTLPQRARRD